MKVYLAFTWESRSGRETRFYHENRVKNVNQIHVSLKRVMAFFSSYHSSQLNALSSE